MLTARKFWSTPSSSGDSDITASLAFQQKKVETLTKESAKLDAEISDAEALYAQENAEWGPQIKSLQVFQTPSP